MEGATCEEYKSEKKLAGLEQPFQTPTIAGSGPALVPVQIYPQSTVYYVASSQECVQNVAMLANQQNVHPPTHQSMMVPALIQQPPPIVVVQQQPTALPANVVNRPSREGNYLTLSVVMTILVLVLGGWPSFLCTVPALLLSFIGKSDERQGNIASARAKANIALGLNVAAVVCLIVTWSVVAVPVGIVSSFQASVPYSYFFGGCSSSYSCNSTSCYPWGCYYSTYYSSLNDTSFRIGAYYNTSTYCSDYYLICA